MNELLDAARGVTDEQAIEIAFSPQVWKAESWQARVAATAPASAFGKLITGWNRRSEAGSRAALGFYLFKMALGPAASAVEPPAGLTDDAMRTALESAAKRLDGEFAPGATYGTLFRAGRQGSPRTWPVSGGSVREAGMNTPRAISFSREGSHMAGRGGQTSTQIVILTKPPRSYMVIPLGESDDPASPHYEDQAEKLFSQGRAKPTFFLDRKALEKHVTARRELEF